MDKTSTGRWQETVPYIRLSAIHREHTQKTCAAKVIITKRDPDLEETRKINTLIKTLITIYTVRPPFDQFVDSQFYQVYN